MEIYQSANSRSLWDISNMAVRNGKKADSEARAFAIYQRLMADRPAGLSNNEWCDKAGVNTSFFTQLKGSKKKAPSEPSIGNLRLVLEVTGSSIPEFFIDEARGRVRRPPTRQALERAIADALPGLPRGTDRRVEYLADSVERALELPAGLRGETGNDERPEEDDSGEASPVPRPTK